MKIDAKVKLIGRMSSFVSEAALLLTMKSSFLISN